MNICAICRWEGKPECRPRREAMDECLDPATDEGDKMGEGATPDDQRDER